MKLYVNHRIADRKPVQDLIGIIKRACAVELVGTSSGARDEDTPEQIVRAALSAADLILVVVSENSAEESFVSDDGFSIVAEYRLKRTQRIIVVALHEVPAPRELAQHDFVAIDVATGAGIDDLVGRIQSPPVKKAEPKKPPTPVAPTPANKAGPPSPNPQQPEPADISLSDQGTAKAVSSPYSAWLLPLTLLERAIKAEPSMKYALAVVGAASAAVLVTGLLSGSNRATILSVALLFFGMVLLYAFSLLMASQGPITRNISIALVVSTVVFYIVFLFFTITAFAINWPDNWVRFLAIQ